MRKNIQAVIEAFKAGKAHTEVTCSTDGMKVWSYSLLIAWRLPNGDVQTLPVTDAPSATTRSQIRAIREAFPMAKATPRKIDTANELPAEPTREELLDVLRNLGCRTPTKDLRAAQTQARQGNTRALDIIKGVALQLRKAVAR